MQLVEQHIIKKSNIYYKELDNLCFLSKNLYNATLYAVRKHFFDEKKYLNYFSINAIFTRERQIDYISLPAKVSKHTQMFVDKAFKSFFKSKVKGRKLPNYLKKDGRFVVHYNKQALSFKKSGYVKLSKTNIFIKTDKKADFVRVVPKGNHIVIEVGYTQQAKNFMNNGNYASIDLGINNLATITSNQFKPLIINGRPLKSINQYANKIRKFEKRNRKIKDYLHKSSRYIVNHLVSNSISTLVIGYNSGWKQETKLGKINNQNFISIPHKTFIDMLDYKCQLEGIKVVIQEESYTSKCSFLDNESIEEHEKYMGIRVKRGLFKSASGKLINADVNGSLNILKKYLLANEVWNEDFSSNLIAVCSMPPSKYSIPLN